MSFADIQGQELAIKCLTRGLERGRIAHAYLFTGPEGVGKEMTALTLAQALNCRVNRLDPCGSCPSCRRIWEDSYPDVKRVVPDGNKIKIAQIRTLRQEAYYRPLEGRRKVYIITEAHKMTEQAANSFLRILEEPPSHALFLLLTTQKAGLLPTIVSRCQNLPFYPLPLDLIRDKLQVEIGLEREEAGVLAALAGGSWGRARELAETGAAGAARRQLLDLTAVICEGDQAKRWQMGGELEKTEDLSLLLEQLLFWFRDLLVLKETGGVQLLLNQDQVSRLGEMEPYYSRRGLFFALDALRETIKMLDTNVNTRLALDVLVGKLEPDSSPTARRR